MGAQLQHYLECGPEKIHVLTGRHEYLAHTYAAAISSRQREACVINNLTLRWTTEQLTEWQKRFALHSKVAVKKTFEATTQHYQSVAYENQMFPTHGFEVRFPALRVKRLHEDVYTDTFEWKHGRKDKLNFQLFVTSKS